MVFQSVIEWLARALEGTGIAVVAAGGCAAIVSAAADRGRRVRGGEHGAVERLARATLPGLEFLVAADIIATVGAVPSAANLLMLTGVVLLRTFLSATLMLEVEGRWPWTGRLGRVGQAGLMGLPCPPSRLDYCS
jgi:uncharacterized membrane protein